MSDQNFLPDSGPSNASEQNPKPRPVRVLLADDDADIRCAMTDMLSHAGYLVDTAEDGSLAWDALQRTTNTYDLLITDNRMPKVSGVELVGKLRTAHMALPVIMVTSAVPEHEYATRPWLIPDATVLKPFRIKELLDKMKTLLCLPDHKTTEPQPARQNRLLSDGFKL